MKRIQVGLVADPTSPTEIARRLSDLGPPGGEDRDAWDVEIVSEPFTTASEDVGAALARLRDQARQRQWDVVIGLTELPFRDEDEGRYLLADTDPQRRTAVLSLPALGGLGRQARARHAVGALVSGMAGNVGAEHSGPVPRFTSRWRLLVGMVLANRPWLLVPGLKSALVAALATGAVARSTRRFGCWLAPCRGGASWWRPSRPSRSLLAGS